MESIVELYPEFSNLVTYRREFNEKNINSLLITGSQGWYSPTGSHEVKPEDTVRDPEVVHSCFETPKIEEAFLKLIEKTGLQSDMIAIQKQFYYVAENENAFRRRHATVPKLLANRLNIKAITAFRAEEELIQHIVTQFIDTGKRQLKDKQA